MAPTRRLEGNDPWDLPHHSESQVTHPARWQRFAGCPRKHISSHVPCTPGGFIRLSLSPLYALSHTHAHTATSIPSQQLSLLRGSDGKEPACHCGRPGFDPLGREDALEKGSGNPTPVFWPGESHGRTEEPGGATVPGTAELERTAGLTLPLHARETITRTVFCSWDRTRGLRSP
jgi:hypothetical protein